MGLILKDASADFSANAVGYINLETTVNAGLEGLWATRLNAARAAASDYGSADAAVIGSPAFNASAGAFGQSNYFDTGIRPSGEFTVAVVMAIHNGGSANDEVLSSSIIGPTDIGGFRTSFYNRRFTALLYTYTAPNLPLTGYAQSTCYMDFTVDRAELLVVRAANGAMDIKAPRAIQAGAPSVAYAGRYVAFNAPPALRTTRSITTLGKDISLVAKWNRALSDLEITTFYSEMKAQLAAYGLAI